MEQAEEQEDGTSRAETSFFGEKNEHVSGSVLEEVKKALP